MLGKSQSDKQKNAARDYQLNNPKTEQMKQKMSVKMKGNTNAKGGKGMKFIHFDYDTQKRVYPSELDYYLSNGWKLGKCQRVIDNQKKPIQKNIRMVLILIKMVKLNLLIIKS